MLEPPLKVTFTKGEWCSGDSNDRRMPLLSEVFEAFPNIPINIDLKAADENLILQVGICFYSYDYLIICVTIDGIIHCLTYTYPTCRRTL